MQQGGCRTGSRPVGFQVLERLRTAPAPDGAGAVLFGRKPLYGLGNCPYYSCCIISFITAIGILRITVDRGKVIIPGYAVIRYGVIIVKRSASHHTRVTLIVICANPLKVNSIAGLINIDGGSPDFRHTSNTGNIYIYNQPAAASSGYRSGISIKICAGSICNCVS